MYNSHRFVYFSQLLSSDANEIQIEKDIVDNIFNFKDDFIVRPHPRGMTTLYEGLNIDNTYSQWELCCAEINGNSVLIGNFSTALFIPKLIYDKEPTVIFTYKMYGNSFVEEAVNRLRTLYSNKQKVMCISSVDELFRKIEDLKKEYDEKSQ